MKTLFINYLVAMALHSKYIISILFSRIAAIVYIIVGVLILKTFYIQSIGCNYDIYGGFFQMTGTDVYNSDILLKNMVTVQTTLNPTANLSVDQNLLQISSNEGGLFMLVSNLFQKIPSWLKLLFRFFLLLIVVLKLLGFNNIFEVFSNLYYLELYLYIIGSLLILYELLCLYLIHKFSNKNISISPILPAFLINWLSEFKEICSTEHSIQVFKKMCYRQISIYISLLVFTILIS